MPQVIILVVEDDPLVREFVVETLREESYHVIPAADGEEALKWCRQRIANLLITDVKLSGPFDGWQVAELCRELDPQLPVVYATGFSPVSPRPVPGSLVLQKPYHPDELINAVRKLTDGGLASP
ncbi:response regulator [Bradyrhizobium sp. CCBAU 53421]|uniref:response regulator n=1 Tax=Bradyrhizobium sp. CCBAU 53421 TaxID=1325120 RepID=UPI00188C16CD|nr:response regulator [Bradyrhizobium sp. CCBAU 53421]QOZ32835.1 response regulator [Bradyrhizobium sp. CCBAU 53421]